MEDLKDAISFKPVFKNTIFDNENDCKWAIFFETMGYTWVYKPLTDYEDVLQPTFSVWGEDIGELKYTYSISSEIPKGEYEKLKNWRWSTGEDLILLDGPPTLGAYVILSGIGKDGLRFDQAQQLMKPPRERFGAILQGFDETIWFDHAEEYFNEYMCENPIAIKIDNAVKITHDSFWVAWKNYKDMCTRNPSGRPRGVTASDATLNALLNNS